VRNLVSVGAERDIQRMPLTFASTASRAGLACVAILSLAGTLAAQATPSRDGSVTRRDLADAYLLVDRVASARGLPADRRAAWNQDFDRTTLAFFGGDFAKVLRDMHDLTARMLGDSAPGSPTRQLLALRLRTAPRVVSPLDRVLRIEATVMYAGEGEPARTLQLRVEDAGGRRVYAGPMGINPGARAGETFTAVVPAGQLGNGNARLTVVATMPGAATELRVPVYTFETRLDDVRDELARAAAAMPSTADPQAVASLRARVDLLRDAPDEGNTAQFLADPVALSAAVVDESVALSAGRNPYRRTGDIWRVLQMPGGRVPFRLYIPPQARTNAALPLVVALHGAGADENMFLEGYGHGRIRTLADSLGFIVVSPMTNDFARDPATLDSLLAVVARSQGFDRTRVYALGHSLGAGVTLRLASQRRDVLRAAVLIAGAGAVPAEQTVVPTLFIGAERDLVIPASRVRAAYEALQGRGAPVEYVLAEGWGHTLVVGAELGRAVEFLLRH
jgi:predicted esterase